jgi:hypothetical protein
LKRTPDVFGRRGHLCLFVQKDLDEIRPKPKLNNNAYIAPIIDLNQTPASVDLAMITLLKLCRYRGPGIRILT